VPSRTLSQGAPAELVVIVTAPALPTGPPPGNIPSSRSACRAAVFVPRRAADPTGPAGHPLLNAVSR
jgi:hypothetical protein